MRPTTSDIIAAIVCTIFLFILVGAAFLEWVSRRITAAINARTPDAGLDILPVFAPVNDIRAELARTTGTGCAAGPADRGDEGEGVMTGTTTPHGTVSRYCSVNTRCRCAPCTAAMTAYTRSRRAYLQPPPEGDPRHGLNGTYTNYGCRCDLCRKANTLVKARWAARRKLAAVSS